MSNEVGENMEQLRIPSRRRMGKPWHIQVFLELDFPDKNTRFAHRLGVREGLSKLSKLGDKSCEVWGAVALVCFEALLRER